MEGVGGNGIDYFHIYVLALCFLSKYIRLGLMFWLRSAAFLNADVWQIEYCFKILKILICRFIYYLLEIYPLITGCRCSHESDIIACGARYAF